MLNDKEKTLLKKVVNYFYEGNKDGDFYKEWVVDWTPKEIETLEDELYRYYDLPRFIDDVQMSCVLDFLLSKL